VLDLGLPHLVAERDGRVNGFTPMPATGGPRPAYRYSVEDSIYIDNDAVGQGVGKLLLPALIRECTDRGKRADGGCDRRLRANTLDPASCVLWASR